MRMPVTFSLYMGRHFLMCVGLMLIGFSGLILLLDLVESLRKLHGREIPLTLVIEMCFMRLPTILQDVLPFSVLLGGIFSFAKLTRTSELVAARAAGLSVWQFLRPGIVVSFLAGIFVITVFNPLAAVMFSRFEKIETRYFQDGSNMTAVSSSGLWLRQRNGDEKTLIHASRVLPTDMTLIDVTFFIFTEEDTFQRRIDAKSAKLTDGYWSIKDAILTLPGQPGKKEDTLLLPTRISLRQIQESFASPASLSFWELPAFIKNLQEAGFSALRHVLHWHIVLATPFKLASMVLIAAIFSLRPPRQGKTGLLIMGGILAGFVIYFLSDLIGALGLSGSIPVFLAAWSPVIIVAFIGGAVVLHREDG